MRKFMNTIMFIIFTSLLVLSITTFSSLYISAFSKKVDTTPPTTPTELDCESNTTESITTTWVSSKDDGGSGVDHYDVFIEKDGSDDFEKYKEVKVENYYPKTRYVVDGLDSNSNYSFKVRAVDKKNNYSEFSNPASEHTDKYEDDKAPEKPPKLNKREDRGPHSVYLDWEAATDEGTPEKPASGIKKYQIWEGWSRYGGQLLGETEGDETTILITDITIPSEPIAGYQLLIYTIDKAGNYSEDNLVVPVNKLITTQK